METNSTESVGIPVHIMFVLQLEIRAGLVRIRRQRVERPTAVRALVIRFGAVAHGEIHAVGVRHRGRS